MSQPASHCAQCQFPFKQMGACPDPNKTMFYAYMSLFPYLIPFFVFAWMVIKRRLSLLKMLGLMVSAYVFTDKFMKKLFKSPRPVISCKTSYGMPSSHMVVMVTIAFYRIRSSKTPLWEKIVWFLLSIGEGVARIELNYHTIEQVLAGSLTAIIYTLIFQKLWQKLQPHLKQGLSFILAKQEGEDKEQ